MSRIRLKKERNNPKDVMKNANAALAERRRNIPRDEDGKPIYYTKYEELVALYGETDRKPRLQEQPSLGMVGAKPLFERHPLIGKTICALLKEGFYYDTVCRHVGVKVETFLRWLEFGRDGHSPIYEKFYHKVMKAEADAEMASVRKLKKHEDADWRASAWLLERRWPRHWARQESSERHVTVSGDVSVNHKHELGKTVVNDVEARELARKMIASRKPVLDYDKQDDDTYGMVVPDE